MAGNAAISIPSQMGPYETEIRKVLSSLSESNYVDDFDWSIYDKLADKFGESRPRGGIVFKSPLKLVNYHTSCSKCHYAFEIDTYGRGCVHNCVYCYAKDQLTAHGYWNRPHPFPADAAEIRKIFYTIFETDRPSKWRSIMESRTPVRLGSMSDCFMWIDRKYRITYELLKILKFYNYPYIVFTRSDLIATDDYLDVLDKNLCSIQFSISGGNEVLTKMIEPGAPSVRRRLNALRILNENGYWTTVRLNPFFPTHPDGYYTNRESLQNRFSLNSKIQSFELFDWDFISQLADAKVPSLLAGFVRLSTLAIRNLSKAAGINFESFFRPEELKKSGDKRFSDAEISYYYTRLKQEAHRHSIRFNTCYIGNGLKDYFQYQHLWDNKNDCCDALGNVDQFTGTSQNIDWPTRLSHAPCKTTAIKALDAENLFNTSTTTAEAASAHA